MGRIRFIDAEANLHLVHRLMVGANGYEPYDDFYDWEAEAFGVKPADLLELQGALAWSFQPQNRGAAGKRCSRLLTSASK